MRNTGSRDIEYMETDWHTLDWNRQIERKQAAGYKVVDLRGKSLHSMSYSRLVQTITEIVNSGGSSGGVDSTIPDAIIAPGNDTQVSYDYESNPLGDSHGGGSGIGSSINFLMDNKTGVFP